MNGILNPFFTQKIFYLKSWLALVKILLKLSHQKLYSFGLMYQNNLTEPFLQGNVSFRHLLNEETLFMSFEQCRNKFIIGKSMEKEVSRSTLRLLSRSFAIWIFFPLLNSGCYKHISLSLLNNFHWPLRIWSLALKKVVLKCT